MTTGVVTALWVVAFSVDLVTLAFGLTTFAEHMEEGRGLFGEVDIHTS